MASSRLTTLRRTLLVVALLAWFYRGFVLFARDDDWDAYGSAWIAWVATGAFLVVREYQQRNLAGSPESDAST